jgi:hypothetical protein
MERGRSAWRTADEERERVRSEREEYSEGRYRRDYRMQDRDEPPAWHREPRSSSLGSERPWRVPGPYRGLGPKGYRRSDQRIKEEISDRLREHPEIGASDIRVDVERGEVRLTGVVDSRKTRGLAEEIADSVLGVSDIRNELQIKEGREESRRYYRPELDYGYALGEPPLAGIGQIGEQRPSEMRMKERPSGRTRSGRTEELRTEKIKIGMEVEDARGDFIGSVAEIQQDGFYLYNRRSDRDIFIPYRKVVDVDRTVRVE